MPMSRFRSGDEGFDEFLQNNQLGDAKSRCLTSQIEDSDEAAGDRNRLHHRAFALDPEVQEACADGHSRRAGAGFGDDDFARASGDHCGVRQFRFNADHHAGERSVCKMHDGVRIMG